MFRDEKIKKDDFQLDEMNTLQSLEIASGADGMRQRHVAPKGAFASGWEKIAKTFDGGVKTAAALDVDGETRPKILSYNPQEQLTVLAPIFALDLTAFKGQLLKHLSWTLYAAVIAAAFLAWDGFDPIMPQPVDEDGAKAGAGPPRAARLLALRLDSIFELGSSDFRSLVAYVLGGFVVRTFTMWYTRRKNSASLYGCTRNMIIQISTFVPLVPVAERNARGSSSGGGDSATQDEPGGQPPLDSATLHAIRLDMGRWAIMALELAFLKPQGLLDDEKARKYLTANGLLKAGEWQAMVGGDRHSTCFFWIQMAATRLHRAQLLSSTELGALCAAVTAMRAQANDIMSSLDRDIPYPYSSLVGTLVNINLFLMTTWKGVVMSLDFCGPPPWKANLTCAEPNLAFVWLSRILLLFLWNLSYSAMFDLAKVLHNPVGPRRLDIANEVIIKGVRKLMEGLVEGHGALPPSMVRDFPGGHRDVAFGGFPAGSSL